MPTSLTQILSGPALVKYRGASFYAKGEIALTPTIDTFEVNVDRFGKVQDRQLSRTVKVSFTPAGEWENLTLLHPYAGSLLGTYITPVQTVSNVDTTDDQLDFAAAHGFLTGDGVRLGTTGALPAGTAAATTYWVNAASSTSIALYDTRAHAISGGATGLVNMTGAGTGTHSVVLNTPLEIHTFNGVKLTLHNAAVVECPDLTLGATETIFGQVVFEGFALDGSDWDDDNSVWTIASEALSDTTFDPDAIITAPYSVAWGATAPWSALTPKDAIKVSVKVDTDEVATDALGTLTRRLKAVSVTASLAPLNVSESDVLTALKLQGSGAARGAKLTGNNLVITGPASGPLVTVYGAALASGPQSFSTNTERIGSLEFRAQRTFSTGVANPLYALATVSA
jgi:hypothetical protein